MTTPSKSTSRPSSRVKSQKRASGPAPEHDPRFRKNREHWNRILDPRNLSEDRSAARLRDELPHWDSSEQAWALKRLEPLQGRRILDLGGGLGVGAMAFAKRGARVVLLDISPQRAKMARRALRREGLDDRVDIVVGAAEHLPFRAGAFHRVTTKSVLIHTRLAQAARELHRILRPGGRAVVVEPLDAHPGIQIYRKFFAPKEWKRITRYWNRRRIEAFARPFGGGGPAIRIRFFHFLGFFSAVFTYSRFRNRRLRRLTESILDPLDRWLIRKFPFLQWRCWFVGVEATHRPQLGHSKKGRIEIFSESSRGDGGKGLSGPRMERPEGSALS